MNNRRLIGPTVICLIMSGLLVDYLYFGDSRWSVVAFLSRIVSVIVKIFGPALNPKLYGWLNDVFLPVAMIVMAVALLWLTIARAKAAMSKATAATDEVIPESAKSTRMRFEEPARQPPSSSAARPQSGSLAWRLTLSFAVVTLAFMAVVSLVSYNRMAGVLETEIKNRAGIAAMALSDIARTGLPNAELQRAIENHASSNLFAYAYIVDKQGAIVAHMPHDLPRFIRRRDPPTISRGADPESVYRGMPVFEVVRRVESSQGGHVYLAFWHDLIAAEVRQTLLPMVAAIFALAGVVSIIFAALIRYLTSSFSQLVIYANRLSHGDLDLDPAIREESDEVRDLARSFSRLRSSLYAVLVRLKDMEAPANHSNELR